MNHDESRESQPLDTAVRATPSTVVQAWYRALAARDSERLRSLLCPDVEFVVADGFPSGGRYRGADAVLGEFFPAISRVLAGLGVDVAEVFTVEGDRVCVRGHYVLHGAGPHGEELDIPFTHLWRVCGDQVAWVQQYTDTALFADAISRAGAAAARPRPASRVGYSRFSRHG